MSDIHANSWTFLPRQTHWDDILKGAECDVLLCQPLLTLRIPFKDQDPDVYHYFNSQATENASLLGDDPFEPNNAILKLASDLRSSGLSVQIIDFHMLDLWRRRHHHRLLNEDDIRQILGRYEYRLLGVSMICVAETWASKIALSSKQTNPRAIVVTGGLLPSAVPALIKERHPHFDEVVVGDGLNRIIELLNCDSSNADHRMPKDNPRAFDLIPVEVPLIPRITTQQGCPLDCAFCSPIRMQLRDPFAGMPIRDRAARTIQEITALRNAYDIDFFVMGNLSFLANSPLDEFVCELLSENQLDMNYWCQMRPDHVTPHRAKLLKKSGCVQVAIGIENSNLDSLKQNKKSYRLPTVANRLDYEGVLRTLRDAGLSTYGYFIIGLPGDSRSDVLATIEMIDSLFSRRLLDSAHISIPVAYPGTPWFDDPKRYGIEILHKDFGRYWMNCDPLGYGPPMMNTKLLKSDDIYELWLLALRTVTPYYQRGAFASRPTRMFNYSNPHPTPCGV